MRIKLLSVFVLILLMVFSGCLTKSDGSNLTIITNQGRVRINVEIADTPEERNRGLMFRNSLGDNNGMLFIFESKRTLSFWMKNTLIPLDMIFVAGNGTITDIKHNVQPCDSDPCPSYLSEYPAKYVVEVNGGFSEENGIKVGDRVDLKTIKD